MREKKRKSERRERAEGRKREREKEKKIREIRWCKIVPTCVPTKPTNTRRNKEKKVKVNIFQNKRPDQKCTPYLFRSRTEKKVNKSSPISPNTTVEFMTSFVPLTHTKSCNSSARERSDVKSRPSLAKPLASYIAVRD